MLKINQTLVKKKKKKWTEGNKCRKCGGHVQRISSVPPPLESFSRCLLPRVFLAVGLQKLPVFFHVKLLQMLSDIGRVVQLSVLGARCF